MNPFSIFVVFLITWWLVLFAVLPMGIKAQADTDDIVSLKLWYSVRLWLVALAESG